MPPRSRIMHTFPIALSQTDITKRNKFVHNTKVAFIVLLLLAVSSLAVGIYLFIGQSEMVLVWLGCGLLSVGLGFSIGSAVTGHLFFLHLSTLSQSKDYRPKSAEVLQSKPYPRQSNPTSRRRPPAPMVVVQVNVGPSTLPSAPLPPQREPSPTPTLQSASEPPSADPTPLSAPPVEPLEPSPTPTLQSAPEPSPTSPAPSPGAPPFTPPPEYDEEKDPVELKAYDMQPPDCIQPPPYTP